MPYLLLFVSFTATLVALFQDHFEGRFRPLFFSVSSALAIAGLVFGIIEQKSDEEELNKEHRYRVRAEAQRQELSARLEELAKYLQKDVAERGEALSQAVSGICLAVPADNAQPRWDSNACRVENPAIYQRIADYSKLTQDLQRLLEGAWQDLNGPTPLPPEFQLKDSVPLELQLPVQELQIPAQLNQSIINERLEGLFEQGAGIPIPELDIPGGQSRP